MGDGARLAESSAVLARIMLLVEDLACSNRVWSCELGYGVFVRWYHVLRKNLTRWTPQPCVPMLLRTAVRLSVKLYSCSV